MLTVTFRCYKQANNELTNVPESPQVRSIGRVKGRGSCTGLPDIG